MTNASIQAAPSLALLALEPSRGVFDLAASYVAAPPARIGDGHPVLVLPGLGAGDWSTLRLRRSLDRAGFATTGWGLGTNRGPDGDFDEWLALQETRGCCARRV